MNKKYYIMSIPIILAVGLLIGWSQNSHQIVPTATDSTATEASMVREINAWGEVAYNTVYQMNVDFPAKVESVHVKEGDEINNGDFLVDLDLLEFEHDIERLAYKQSLNEAMLNGVVQHTAGLMTKIAQADKDVATAQRNVDNYEVLYHHGSVSKDTLDQYIDTLNSKNSDLKVLQVELEQLEHNNSNNTDQRTNDLNIVRKELQALKDKKNKPYLSGNQLTCHLDQAIIKRIYAENGTILGGSMVTVLELIDKNSIYIRAEVNEEYIQHISLNTEARIVPTMNPEMELIGKVSHISSMAIEKNGERIVEVQVIMEELPDILKPGYTAELYFPFDQQ